MRKSTTTIIVPMITAHMNAGWMNGITTTMVNLMRAMALITLIAPNSQMALGCVSQVMEMTMMILRTAVDTTVCHL